MLTKWKDDQAKFTEIVCPQCGTRNRVRRDLTSLPEIRARCGNCQSVLSPDSDADAGFSHEEPLNTPVKKTSIHRDLFTKFFVVSGLLILLRYSLEFISNTSVRKYLIIGTFILFISIRYLRKAFLHTMTAIILSITVIYHIVYLKEIVNGKIRFDQAVNDIMKLTFSFGPGREITRIITYENYGRYLSKIDPRNKKINAAALRITRNCHDNDHLCEVSMILRFVTNSIVYREDPRGSEDYIRSPLETLQSESGDCEDQTILLISLLESIGKKTYMIFTHNHAYALVCFEKDIFSYLKNSHNREYIESYLPNNDLSVLWEFYRNHYAIRIYNWHCYELEPTARDSWIGFRHNIREIRAVFDPVTKKEVKYVF